MGHMQGFCVQISHERNFLSVATCEDYYSRPSYENPTNTNSLQRTPGSVMYETISWMLWDADMMARYHMICRMHLNVRDVGEHPHIHEAS